MSSTDSDNPFAALAGLRDALPEGPAQPPAVAAAPATTAKPPARAVVRFQRKGYGGKTVTLVEQLGLDGEALEALLKRFKKELGCGGRRDGDALVLQGDRRKRLAEALRAMGVKRVTVS